MSTCSDVHGQVELAEKLKEVNVLREKVQELSRRKKELEERLKCMPKDLVVAKILKDVTVDGMSNFCFYLYVKNCVCQCIG